MSNYYNRNNQRRPQNQNQSTELQARPGQSLVSVRGYIVGPPYFDFKNAINELYPIDRLRNTYKPDTDQCQFIFPAQDARNFVSAVNGKTIRYKNGDTAQLSVWIDGSSGNQSHQQSYHQQQSHGNNNNNTNNNNNLPFEQKLTQYLLTKYDEKSSILSLTNICQDINFQWGNREHRDTLYDKLSDCQCLSLDLSSTNLTRISNLSSILQCFPNLQRLNISYNLLDNYYDMIDDENSPLLYVAETLQELYFTDNPCLLGILTPPSPPPQQQQISPILSISPDLLHQYSLQTFHDNLKSILPRLRSINGIQIQSFYTPLKQQPISFPLSKLNCIQPAVYSVITPFVQHFFTLWDNDRLQFYNAFYSPGIPFTLNACSDILSYDINSKIHTVTQCDINNLVKSPISLSNLLVTRIQPTLYDITTQPALLRPCIRPSYIQAIFTQQIPPSHTDIDNIYADATIINNTTISIQFIGKYKLRDIPSINRSFTRNLVVGIIERCTIQNNPNITESMYTYQSQNMQSQHIFTILNDSLTLHSNDE